MTPMPPLAITMGEPAGIGGELTLKAWLAASHSDRPFFTLDDPDRLQAVARTLGLDVPVQEISSPEEAARCFSSALPVVPVRLRAPVRPGRPDPLNAPATLEAIERAAAEAGREEDEEEEAPAPLPWRWSVGPHARIPKPRRPPPTPPRKKRSLIEEEGGEQREEEAVGAAVLCPAAPAPAPAPPPPPPPQGSRTPASTDSSTQTLSDTLRNRLAANCCLTWRTRLLLLLLLLLELELELEVELEEAFVPAEELASPAKPTPATSSDALAASPSSRHPSPIVPPNLLVSLSADFSEFPACALTDAEARRVASARERQASS